MNKKEFFALSKTSLSVRLVTLLRYKRMNFGDLTINKLIELIQKELDKRESGNL